MRLQGGQLMVGRAAGLAESDGGTSQCHGCPAQFRPQNQADAQMETVMCQKGLAGRKASDTRGALTYAPEPSHPGPFCAYRHITLSLTLTP